MLFRRWGDDSEWRIQNPEFRTQEENGIHRIIIHLQRLLFTSVVEYLSSLSSEFWILDSEFFLPSAYFYDPQTRSFTIGKSLSVCCCLVNTEWLKWSVCSLVLPPLDLYICLRSWLIANQSVRYPEEKLTVQKSLEIPRKSSISQLLFFRKPVLSDPCENNFCPNPKDRWPYPF